MKTPIKIEIRSKLRCIQLNKDQLEKKIHEIPFPEFMLMMRQIHCLSRKIVSDDLDIPYVNYSHMEEGRFRSVMSDSLLGRLASYYDLNFDDLKESLILYVEKRTKKLAPLFEVSDDLKGKV